MSIAAGAGSSRPGKAPPQPRTDRVPRHLVSPSVLAGPLAPATRVFTQAQQRADQRVKVAQGAIERHVSLPAIPQLRNPTPQQRHAAKALVARSLRGQGISTGGQVSALPRAQRQQVTRIAGHAGVSSVLPSIRGAHGHASVGVHKSSGGGGVLGLPGAVVSAANTLAPLAARGIAAVGTLGASEIPGLKKPFDVARRVGTGALRDAVNIPAETIPSLYHLGDQAAHGHFGEVARELAQPYIDAAQHPLRSLLDHPLGTALLASGAESAVGRTAGAAGRLTGVRSFATDRAPLELPGTSIRVPRRYSPDPARKGVQVLAERRAAGKAQRLDRQAARVEASNPERAQQLRERAAQKRPHVTDAEVKTRMTERWDAGHILQRAMRDQAVAHVDQILKGRGRQHSTLVSLVAQGIVHPTREDIGAYVNELRAAHPNLDRVGKRANAKLVGQIQKSLDNKSLDLHRVAGQAAAFTAHTAPLEQSLIASGLLDAGEAQRARLVPFAARRLGARVDEHGQLVDRHGTQLSIDEVRAQMRQHGVGEPAFVPQRLDWTGARNFYAATARPASIDRRTRSGAATATGTFDAHPEALRQQAARLAVLTTQQRQFGRMLDEFGFKPRGDRLHIFGSRTSAIDASKYLMLDEQGRPVAGATEWVPVQAAPFHARAGQLAETMRQAGSSASPVHTEMLRALDDALQRRQAAGPAPYVLMPRPAIEELRAHLNKLQPGNVGRAFQAYNSLFRKSVLATSPKWLAGNVVEGAVRSAVGGVIPVYDQVIYRRTLRALEESDPEAAAELRARVTQGGQYAMAQRAPHRSADQFTSGPLRHVAAAVGAVGHAPGGKQLVGAWNLYTHVVFERVNRPAERWFQQGMAGKQIRGTLMDGHMGKLSAQAVQQAAKGLKDTNEQVALGRAVDRMYGKYGKFSPGQRQALSLYTPFLAWALAATKFLGDVLPRDHPVLTSILASANQATQGWRQKHGQDLFAKGRVPGFLQGGIPAGGGGVLRASRYTPFSLATDPLGTFAGEVLPQAQDVLAAARGQDWRGRPLHKGTGGSDPVQGAGDVLGAAATVLPFAGPASRVAGGTGSLGARLNKEFNPAAPSRPKPKKSGAATANLSPAEARALAREAQHISAGAGGGGGASSGEVQSLLREAEYLRNHH